MQDEDTTTPETSPHKGKTGLVRIYNALFYSFDGLVGAFKSESAFRQEVALAVLLIPTALLLPLTPTQKALLCASVFLVLIVELLNFQFFCLETVNLKLLGCCFVGQRFGQGFFLSATT